MNIRKLIQGIMICAAMLVVAACGSDSSTSSTSGDGYINYDDFTGTTISTVKWTNAVDAGGTVSIVNNAFQANLNADGSLVDNDARIVMADAGNPDSVTGLEVTLNVSEATETSGGFRGRLQGTFYNDGTLAGAAAGSAISDIVSGMQITGFGGTTTGNTGIFVVRCTNTDCSTNVGIGISVPFPTFGTVQLSENHTFRMEFDRTSSRFTFTMDSAITVTVDAAALGAAFSTAPNTPGVKIGIRGNNTPIGTMTATFDDFRCKGCTVP